MKNVVTLFCNELLKRGGWGWVFVVVVGFFFSFFCVNNNKSKKKEEKKDIMFSCLRVGIV